jgi:prenylcysteine oxidase/farnesylcysteine lyase
MFNQETRMAGFPGLVGLIGAGLAGGGLLSVDGGNQRLVEGSLRLAGAEVHTGARVSRVHDDRSVELADGSVIPADIVVLAVPLAVAGIDLPAAVELPPTRYRHVHVTLVAGRLSESYFGMANPPETIFTASGENRPFNSAARIGWSRSNGVPIFKFFGTQALPDAAVRQIVDDVREIKRIEWDAYPLMEVAPQTAPFEIAPGIFFPNALEAVISTLETESLAGRIVGDLVAQRLEGADDSATVSATA